MRYSRLLPLLAIVSIGIPILSICAAGADSLDAVQRTAVAWAQLRSEATRLEADWQRERALLETSAAVLAERIAALEQRRSTLDLRSAEVRREIDALRERHRVLTESVAAMETRLGALVVGLVELRPFLPPRLSAALELPYRSVADETLGTSERAQYAIAILGRCLQFNRSITFSEEVIDASVGGDARVLEVVYWGLAGAYALDRVEGRAFAGRPGERGWAWSPCEDAAAVRELIDVHKDRVEPRFTEVPAQVRGVQEAEGRP